jgi:hypothetical protein
MTGAMKKLLGIVIVCLSSAAPAAAQTAAPTKIRAVIELFTSQGCSSCPPADRLITEIGKDPSIITLTLPVDYWDYLGWKDTLAQSAFTQRQKAYAAMRTDRQVYTPQAVINGMYHAVGSQRPAIDKAIEMTSNSAATLSVSVDLAKTSTGVEVKLPAQTGGVKQGVVWALPYVNGREVNIGRGENSGRTVTYSNVVLKATPLGIWNGDAMTLAIPSSSLPANADGLVILLQAGTDKKAAQTLGAGRISKL